ncbi:MAG: threonylcarbamoyl-AMP synthase [Chloroflexi bacterium]|nr:threonylcarbamoyl-AMP synthase [Chloroflexota bacterium]
MESEYETQVYPATDEIGVALAVRLLREGQVVAFPTDTVYGVGCDLWQPEAIERLYWVKQRPHQLAIPVLVATPQDVAQVASHLPASFAPLAERFWPGGLTLIVPRRPEVPDILCMGGPTVAVRMPDHPLALRLIAALGGALAVTSANLSGHPAPTTATEVLADLQGRVPLILDGGRCAEGVASTIISLVADPPVLLRRGAISVETLRQAVPSLVESLP